MALKLNFLRSSIGILWFHSLLTLINGHAFLSSPISRNAVGIVERGYCDWNGPIPCTGCPHCWNVEEPTTGCGITQANSPPYVFNGGELSFANTGVKTTYTQGETIAMEVVISTYHGGRFQFRIQDVGVNNDPDGSLWQTLDPLTVESYSPVCDDPSQGCAADPCLAQKTCMYIPLQPYGDHNYFYTMHVKLPDQLTCTHCVLQWHWLTSNSCPQDYIACQGSEEFWNCADLEIVPSGGGGGENPPAGSPTEVPSACSTDTTGGDSACSGHGQVACGYDQAASCWVPVWTWPNDKCELRDSACQEWELSQGGASWSSCCSFNGHCKGTGLLEPQMSVDCSGECECFDGWTGDSCDVCSGGGGEEPQEPSLEVTAAPTPTPSTPDVVTNNPSHAPTRAQTTGATDPCTDVSMCHSTQRSDRWYVALTDAWCQVDCEHLVAKYPARCVQGCRPSSGGGQARRSLLATVGSYLLPSHAITAPAPAGTASASAYALSDTAVSAVVSEDGVGAEGDHHRSHLRQ